MLQISTKLRDGLSIKGEWSVVVRDVLNQRCFHFLLAIAFLLSPVVSSQAFAQDADSIESLVKSGALCDSAQAANSDVSSLSVKNSDGAAADYNTVETEDGSILKWKEDGTQSAKIVGYETLSRNLVVPSKIEGRSVIALADMVMAGVVVPNSTFSGAEQLESVVLPESMKVLSGCDFSGCVNLKRITLGNSLVYMGMSEFSDCSALKSIVIPDTCKTIDSVAFMSCTSLSSVHLPTSITQLGSGVFGGCSALASIEIPAGVTSVGGGCFEGSALKTVSLPKGLKTVEATAFRSCPLNWAYIPSSVIKIGDSAFDPGVLVIADSGKSQARTWAISNSKAYIAGTLDDYWKVSVARSVKYSGFEQRPEVVLRNSNYDEFPLDYASVEYSNNINVGTATCKITSNIVSGEQKCSFDIEKRDIGDKDVTISPIDKQIYKGEPLVPTVKISLGDYSLIEGTDYDCSYSTTSSYSSSGKVVVSGRGNFTGSETVWFDIERAPVTIAFETYGGTEIPPYTGEYGTTYGIWQYVDNNKPSKDGCHFLGWFKDPEFKFPWDYYVDAPMGDMTVYAKWDSSVSASRLAGETRYGTSAKIAEQYGNFDKLVIVSGENFPDALSASVLAGALNAPIALTASGYLPWETKSLIREHQLNEIVVVGGPAAVSDSVVDSLGSAAPGATVNRIWGETRYETAENVCFSMFERDLPVSDTGIIASGSSFADALSVAPYSASAHAPILLSGPGGLSQDTLSAFKSAGLNHVIIVGGTAAVPQYVENQLDSYGISNVTRLAGDTRYETSAKIAEFEVASDAASKVYCAAGSNFPDALSAGPLSALTKSPILLVDERSQAAQGWLEAKRGRVTDLCIVGGPSAVSDDLVATLRAAAEM